VTWFDLAIWTYLSFLQIFWPLGVLLYVLAWLIVPAYDLCGKPKSTQRMRRSASGLGSEIKNAKDVTPPSDSTLEDFPSRIKRHISKEEEKSLLGSTP
jgi:hypothetical protein